MTLDRVNNRLFISHHGPGRYDIYQLDENGLPLRQHADKAVGSSLLGRGFAPAPLGNKELNFPRQGDFDSVHQRLFVPDMSSTGTLGVRILAYDLSPAYLASIDRKDLPEATAVLGQPHFDTWEPGIGPAKIGGPGQVLVDDERQLLFYTDSANNRVLIWDIDPSRLESGMEAIAVIGQPDFFSKSPGNGPGGLANPGSLTYDPKQKHLYVGDGGNRRVLVFNVRDQDLDRKTGMEAFAVIGQDDFNSRANQSSKRKISMGPMSLDHRYHRLFVASFTDNRVMIFDVNPDKLRGAYNPDAIAVLGKPDFEDTDTGVTQTLLTMTRITVDSERQLAYVPDGYTAGNRINVFDIHPDRMQETLTPMIGQIGHINPDGDPDFMARQSNDRVSPRYWAQVKGVSLDTIDHRLFLTDTYGHRIMIFKLDRMNRLLDREASWVLGQPDPHTSHLLPGQNATTTIKLPMAVDYDESYKRLFVADTWNDRVLVYDVTPGRIESGMAAAYVLGQKDFTSYDPGVSQDRIYYGSRQGVGIGPRTGNPAGLVIDKTHQRLFVTDGSNHRVLVFDVHPDRIASGAKALYVIGQDDFTSRETGLSASRWRFPGDLVLDEARQRLFVSLTTQHRVLVFDVDPERLKNGSSATHVIGQADFTSEMPGLSRTNIRLPDRITYDQANDHLYVSDKDNHRVVVFDVHPDRLRNSPEAVAVIGESGFDQLQIGPGVPRTYQDRLYNPRGSDFDAADQRLFLSDDMNTQIKVFTIPRNEYRVDLPARASLKYSSLDALLSTGPEPLTSGYARAKVNTPGKILGVSMHMVTRAFIHDQSERQSRELLAAAMLPAPSPTRHARIYAEQRDGAETNILAVNGGERRAQLTITYEPLSGERQTVNRRLQGGEQLSARLGELFPSKTGSHGVVTLTSDRDLGLGAVLESPPVDGVSRIAPAPLWRGNELPVELSAKRRVLPALPLGAGRQVRVVLLNPATEPVRGHLELPGREPLSYQIPAGGAFVEDLVENGPVETGYALVRSDTGPAPLAYALVLHKDRMGHLRSMHTIDGQQEGTLFWAPLETYPDVLQHGDIEAGLTLVNEGPVPATVYLELFDPDGRSRGKFERMVPLAEQVVLDLEEVFGYSPVRGVLRVFSDSRVNAVLLEETRTVGGSTIVMAVPLQTTPAEAIKELLFPLFHNGEGHATEVMLLNTDRQSREGKLAVHTVEGKARQVVLR